MPYADVRRPPNQRGALCRAAAPQRSSRCTSHAPFSLSLSLSLVCVCARAFISFDVGGSDMAVTSSRPLPGALFVHRVCGKCCRGCILGGHRCLVGQRGVCHLLRAVILHVITIQCVALFKRLRQAPVPPSVTVGTDPGGTESGKEGTGNVLFSTINFMDTECPWNDCSCGLDCACKSEVWHTHSFSRLSVTTPAHSFGV